MTLEGLLGKSGIFNTIALVIMIAFWFTLTVFILCIMEVGASNNVRCVHKFDSCYVRPPAKFVI